MDAQLKAEIEELVQKHSVVLFMKGTKSFPQCGFSATVVNILKEVGAAKELKDVNILARADLREAMKEYSNWPTFPQLYVKGEFVGGCDIVKEMFAAGELHDVFGVAKPEIKQPVITITEAAKRAVLEASEGEPPVLRIEVSPAFEYALSIDEPKANDFRVDAQGVTLLLDPQSAQRADGMRIDFLASSGGGFKIENPNEPARVRQIGPRELKALLDQGKPVELFDVRTPEERAIVKLAQAQAFDKAAQDKLAKLDRDTPLYFHCHHGGRSQQAAEHYLRQGFKNVFNVAGGIDGYALEIDPELPRY